MKGNECKELSIQIPYSTSIGQGFVIKHYGTIVIAPQARIGNNVTILQGVTIGKSHIGDRTGWPTIKDDCIIFAGAKIIGNITIGQGCVVGANAVVIKDVPDNSIVAGVPANVVGINNGEWQSILM